MRKIKDKVTLGTVAGLAGSAISIAAQYGVYKLRWTTSTWAHQAIGATVSEKHLKSKTARALGIFTALYVDAFYGIAQTYLYSLTGRDNMFIKATGSGVMSWLVLHGLSSRLTHTFGPRDTPPKTSLVSLATALFDSYITGALIPLLGDESIFPDKSRGSKSNIPDYGIDRADQVSPENRYSMME